jgi:hypothetical protein
MVTDKMDAPTPPVGVIESLSQGFETVAGQLVLILLPLLVDMLLWVGPRITFGPVLETYYQQVFAVDNPIIAASEDEELEAVWGELSASMLGLVEDIPVIYLPLSGVPSLLAGRTAAVLPFEHAPETWEIQTGWGIILSNLALISGGILLGSLYLALIAYQVKDGRINIGRLILRFPLISMQMTLLIILVAIIYLAVMIPFMLIGGILSLFSIAVGQVVSIGGLIVVMWVSMFGVFTIHGMLLNENKLPASIWDSIRVVQWNVSATLLLFLLVFIVSSALTRYVWSLPEPDTWMVLLGIMGHAFVTTGLTAATFVFFKDRYRYWQDMSKELMAELERKRAERHS